MTAWTQDELTKVGQAEELELASTRPDGSLSPFVTIWVVRAGDELYVRSALGPNRPWYRRARASGTGRVRAGGVEQDVTFGDAAADVQAAIDTAFRSKYSAFSADIVDPVVGKDTWAVTIRLVRAGA